MNWGVALTISRTFTLSSELRMGGAEAALGVRKSTSAEPRHGGPSGDVAPSSVDAVVRLGEARPLLDVEDVPSLQNECKIGSILQHSIEEQNRPSIQPRTTIKCIVQYERLRTTTAFAVPIVQTAQRSKRRCAVRRPAMLAAPATQRVAVLAHGAALWVLQR